jgi:1,4-dihydroxy-2-naphthoyl-CoA hydrolase
VQSQQPSAFPAGYDSPFDNQLGLVYTEVSPDCIKAQLDVTPKLLQPAGIVHGGVYCSMVESMASTSAFVWLSANGGGEVVGVNNNTDFLRAISAGTVYGVTEPVHRGRRQQLWLVTITDQNGKLVARGQVRLQNLEPRPADA